MRFSVLSTYWLNFTITSRVLCDKLEELTSTVKLDSHTSHTRKLKYALTKAMEQLPLLDIDPLLDSTEFIKVKDSNICMLISNVS